MSDDAKVVYCGECERREKVFISMPDFVLGGIVGWIQ